MATCRGWFYPVQEGMGETAVETFTGQAALSCDHGCGDKKRESNMQVTVNMTTWTTRNSHQAYIQSSLLLT
jgi:hypothetical protein